MALKFLLKTTLLLKVDHYEGILNQIKIEGIVNDHLSSCSLQRFQKVYTNIAKNRLQF